MDLRLSDFIKIYDDVLDKNICNELIDIFEKSLEFHERVENDRKPNFTQFNLTANSNLNEINSRVHNQVISKVLKYKKEYYKYIDNRCFPEKNSFEQFRIKKYNTDGNDLFDTHVDVMDHESSRRFLSFLFYLNDVEDGGETEFEGLVIKPKSGRMIVFPPFWTFPHKGNAPRSNSKYIMSTYLHYK